LYAYVAQLVERRSFIFTFPSFYMTVLSWVKSIKPSKSFQTLIKVRASINIVSWGYVADLTTPCRR
jgi:hypothetical protein